MYTYGMRTDEPQPQPQPQPQELHYLGEMPSSYISPHEVFKKKKKRNIPGKRRVMRSDYNRATSFFSHTHTLSLRMIGLLGTFSFFLFF